jgi:hypothetical protein
MRAVPVDEKVDAMDLEYKTEKCAVCGKRRGTLVQYCLTAPGIQDRVPNCPPHILMRVCGRFPSECGRNFAAIEKLVRSLLNERGDEWQG